MVKERLDNHGVTLMELLVAAMLSGLVIFTVGNMYVAGMKQAVEMQEAVLTMDPKASLETIARAVAVGYEYDVRLASEGEPGPHGIWVRVDGVPAWPALTVAPNSTPDDRSDDRWIKFGCIGSRIRVRRDLVDDIDDTTVVGGTDSVLMANVACSGGKRTIFESLPSRNQAMDRTVRITLVTHPSRDPADRPSVTTDVTLASKPMVEP